MNFDCLDAALAECLGHRWYPEMFYVDDQPVALIGYFEGTGATMLLALRSSMFQAETALAVIR